MKNSRREFIKFLGVTGLTLSQLSLLRSLTSCSLLPIKSLSPSLKDELILLEGLNYYPIISWGDKINATETFGFNNDYITFKPINDNELIMWVNHEYTHPLFVSGLERTKENIDKERRAVGGSILKLKKINSKWKFILSDKVNKGVRGDTKIPFANKVEVKGSRIAEGTCSNCAGGYTPWGTFLSCEENSDKNYGQVDPTTGEMIPSFAQWEKAYPNQKSLPKKLKSK